MTNSTPHTDPLMAGSDESAPPTTAGENRCPSASHHTTTTTTITLQQLLEQPNCTTTTQPQPVIVVSVQRTRGLRSKRIPREYRDDKPDTHLARQCGKEIDRTKHDLSHQKKFHLRGFTSHHRSTTEVEGFTVSHLNKVNNSDRFAMARRRRMSSIHARGDNTEGLSKAEQRNANCFLRESLSVEKPECVKKTQPVTPGHVKCIIRQYRKGRSITTPYTITQIKDAAAGLTGQWKNDASVIIAHLVDHKAHLKARRSITGGSHPVITSHSSLINAKKINAELIVAINVVIVANCFEFDCDSDIPAWLHEAVLIACSHVAVAKKQMKVRFLITDDAFVFRTGGGRMQVFFKLLQSGDVELNPGPCRGKNARTIKGIAICDVCGARCGITNSVLVHEHSADAAFESFDKELSVLEHAIAAVTPKVSTVCRKMLMYAGWGVEHFMCAIESKTMEAWDAYCTMRVKTLYDRPVVPCVDIMGNFTSPATVSTGVKCCKRPVFGQIDEIVSNMGKDLHYIPPPPTVHSKPVDYTQLHNGPGFAGTALTDAGNAALLQLSAQNAAQTPKALATSPTCPPPPTPAPKPWPQPTTHAGKQPYGQPPPPPQVTRPIPPPKPIFPPVPPPKTPNLPPTPPPGNPPNIPTPPPTPPTPPPNTPPRVVMRDNFFKYFGVGLFLFLSCSFIIVLQAAIWMYAYSLRPDYTEYCFDVQTSIWNGTITNKFMIPSVCNGSIHAHTMLRLQDPERFADPDFNEFVARVIREEEAWREYVDSDRDYYAPPVEMPEDVYPIVVYNVTLHFHGYDCLYMTYLNCIWAASIAADYTWFGLWWLLESYPPHSYYALPLLLTTAFLGYCVRRLWLRHCRMVPIPTEFTMPPVPTTVLPLDGLRFTHVVDAAPGRFWSLFATVFRWSAKATILNIAHDVRVVNDRNIELVRQPIVLERVSFFGLRRKRSFFRTWCHCVLAGIFTGIAYQFEMPYYLDTWYYTRLLWNLTGLSAHGPIMVFSYYVYVCIMVFWVIFIDAIDVRCCWTTVDHIPAATVAVAVEFGSHRYVKEEFDATFDVRYKRVCSCLNIPDIDYMAYKSGTKIVLEHYLQQHQDFQLTTTRAISANRLFNDPGYVWWGSQWVHG